MTGKRSAERWYVRMLLVLVALSVMLPLAVAALPQRPASDAGTPRFLLEDDDKPARNKKPKKKKSTRREGSGKKAAEKIRWGQRLNESDEEYDKRFATRIKRIKQDTKGDYNGGQFFNEKGEEIQLWTYMGHPFIIRTDIDKEFTAHMTMYMEHLHREFSSAYFKLLGKAADVKEPVEIITFADRGAYMRAGGHPASGGQFAFAMHFSNDRGRGWPAKHYRMMQFTKGVTDFSKWPKDVLKHESCHMELYMRVGYKLDPTGTIGFPIIPPIWWNEGQAGIFEWWDFRKSVEENFEEIPTRGRYVPMIRRTYGTDDWKDFDYYWTINRAKWDSEGRVLLNYAQGWSICGYMMTGGREGIMDFRRIFDLTKRVGTNDPDISFSERKVGFSRAWAEVFSPEAQDKMSKNWEKWVKKHVPKDGTIPDEDYYIRKMNCDPSVSDRLQPITDEKKLKENEKWVEKEERRRKKATVVEW